MGSTGRRESFHDNGRAQKDKGRALRQLDHGNQEWAAFEPTAMSLKFRVPRSSETTIQETLKRRTNATAVSRGVLQGPSCLDYQIIYPELALSALSPKLHHSRSQCGIELLPELAR